MEILERSSPNFGPRRDGLRPELVVLHHTAMLTAEAALERLCDPAAEVSAHYLIAEDGRVWRLVAEAERAWHAGAGSWGGRGDVNSRSIGIELANAGPLYGFPPFAEPQMAALERLLDGVMARWAIPPEGVIAHSDMAPERKFDPGPKFDWRRLARSGRAVWPGEAADLGGWEAFRGAAAAAGYAAPDGDWEPVLAAARLRFRPWAKGEPEGADVAAMRACVDRGAVPT
ncbi:MAG TPA: N-acetylmuramoyl-L-alanine amidase [Amaricoccus sp.]|nr:N-acetylmuramoyl-L-alanine amidase [Amaricoccus sp.]